MDFRDRDRQAGEKRLGRPEGSGSRCQQPNTCQYNQLPFEMLQTWWQCSLLDSLGPMELAQGLTEPTPPKS